MSPVSPHWYLRGWTAYFGISQYYRPVPELDEWIRRRIRMCYWKQWRWACTKIYLGRYLYRGVIQEKDILRCENGQVTYRWRDSKTGKPAQRSVSAVEFLRLVLQHVLPKGFRRARNYGFLHPNSKRLIALLRLLVFKPCGKVPTQLAQATQTDRPKLLCRCCGAVMAIVRRRILPLVAEPPRANREAILNR